MSKPDIADLAVGTKVRVAFEGEIVTVGGTKRVKVGERPRMTYPYGSAPQVIPSTVVELAKAVEILGPTWQPGDVVVVRYHGPRSTAYTYVRGARMWPGENAPGKSDAQITALFGEGKVEHVLRDGKPVSKPTSINAGSLNIEAPLRRDALRPPRPGGRILRDYPF